MMTAATDTSVRDPSLIELKSHPPREGDGWCCWTGRGQTFRVDWFEATRPGSRTAVASAWEALVLVPAATAWIHHGGRRIETAGKAVAIVPAGGFEVELTPGGPCIVLTSLGPGENVAAINAGAYADPDARILPCEPAYRRRTGSDTVRVLAIADVTAPADKPRLKMLQTATLSINWVEYDGPRNRAALSPHAHSRFEQGSLGISGRFVHHLRVEWGSDANLWQDDRHAELAPPSLMVVPAGLIHTSEGVGPGHHLLIDIFSPPRADFRAKGWIANADDYDAPEDVQ
jgi:hypothetical protein